MQAWNADLQLLYEVYAHEYPIYHMVAGNASEFFTSASDSTIYHWEDQNGKLELLDILRGHQEPAWRLKYLEIDFILEIQLAWQVISLKNNCIKIIMASLLY